MMSFLDEYKNKGYFVFENLYTSDEVDKIQEIEKDSYKSYKDVPGYIPPNSYSMSYDFCVFIELQN